MKTDVILLAFAIPCIVAQVPASTNKYQRIEKPQKPAVVGGIHVGKHQMGETFKQWMENSGIDLGTTCPPREDDSDYYRRPYHPPNDDRSQDCLLLMPIQYTGSGTFKENIPFDGPDPSLVDWVFDDGKLAQHSIGYRKSDMQEHLGFLTQAYGPPKSKTFSTYQNAYGATWKRLQVLWNTADGGSIVLGEFDEFNHAGQFVVTFTSGDFQRKESAEKKTANPYTH